MSVFTKQGNQWIVRNDVNDEASINDICKSLGYETNQFYSYMNFDQPYDYDNNSDSIQCICLKVMTEDIICVITNPGRTILSKEDVNHYMEDFVFSREYSYYSFEEDLKSAISEHNWSIQFVGDTLGVSYSPDDTELYSSRYKMNFIFEGGYLVDYEIADGYNREAHDLEESGSPLYEKIETHAQNYHGSNDDAIINEINIQCNAFYNVPSGVNNENLRDFANADGSYNFKMLLVAKYQGTEYEQGINYEDCKCVCHNELKFEGNVDEGLDKLAKYRYRDYLLTFDDKGTLVSCVYSKNTSRSTQNNSNNSDAPQTSGSGCMLTLMSVLCFMMMMVAAIIVVF